MKGTGRNDDFVYLAVAPVLAAIVFFVFYVGGWMPPVPVPQFTVPLGSQLDNLREYTSMNKTSAITIAVAIVVGMIGVTWFIMIVLDLKRGVSSFARWITRRPPRQVSGLLRHEEDATWSVHMAKTDEPIKTYKAKSSGWLREERSQ